MDGNEEAQKKYLKEKCISFGARMRAAKCTKNVAMYTFKSSLLPALEYALPVTNLSKAEWDKVLAPALVPFLHKSGVSKNISCAPSLDL